MIGLVLKNRYQITQLLGEGGMANVYLATDKVKNRLVAIKIIKEETAKDPLNIARFQRELKASAALTHRNIVSIYDYGDCDDRPYMVMEYINGPSLRDVLKKRGVLPPLEAADIMLQLTDALALAHSNGIIHRDVKPQNIMVQADGNIKLTDFGIATIPLAPKITMQEMVLGTVHYMAPEFASGKSAANPGTDIYAAGITFFELLVGRVPFDDSEARVVAQKHIKQTVPNVCDIDPTIPAGFGVVIAKATAKNPLERYQSARLMRNDIMKLMRHDTKVKSSSFFDKIKRLFGRKK